MMRLSALFLCLLPLSAGAAKLADCDTQAYDVRIVNGGQARMAHLTPLSASVQEFGPTVSFQLKDQKPVVVTEQADEYCIWHGKIIIQRRNPGNDANGGFHLR